MTLEEFKTSRLPKPIPFVKAHENEERLIVMGPTRSLAQKNMSHLDAGLCPLCNAMVKEVAAPIPRIDFRVVFYVCVEDSNHRFSRPELTRMHPSAVQLLARFDHV